MKYFNTQWTTTIIMISVCKARYYGEDRMRSRRLFVFVCLSERGSSSKSSSTHQPKACDDQPTWDFLPTLWSSDPWKVVIFWSDCVSSLLPPVYVSMLEDDLKLSSSEDSDGEQDPAKNASRNTLGRWAGSTASFTRQHQGCPHLGDSLFNSTPILELTVWFSIQTLLNSNGCGLKKWTLHY